MECRNFFGVEGFLFCEFSGRVSHERSCVPGTVATLMTLKTMTMTLIHRRPAHV